MPAHTVNGNPLFLGVWQLLRYVLARGREAMGGNSLTLWGSFSGDRLSRGRRGGRDVRGKKPCLFRLYYISRLMDGSDRVGSGVTGAMGWGLKGIALIKTLWRDGRHVLL